MASPDYFSCEEPDEFSELFQSRCDFLPDTEIEIDFLLKNSNSYVNYDSELTIAAFHGCLRIGKVFSKHCVNETQIGLNKSFLLELPIYFIPRFVRELANGVSYICNKSLNPINEEIQLGEVTNKKFLFCKKHFAETQKIFTLLLKSQDCVVYELSFNSITCIKHFAKQFFNLVLDTTSPQPYQQHLTNSFLEKIDQHQDDLIKKLFDNWMKQKKMDVLWKAVSEVVFEKKKKDHKRITSLFFVFIKNNIGIIFSMHHLFKISRCK